MGWQNRLRWRLRRASYESDSGFAARAWSFLHASASPRGPTTKHRSPLGHRSGSVGCSERCTAGWGRCASEAASNTRAFHDRQSGPRLGWGLARRQAGLLGILLLLILTGLAAGLLAQRVLEPQLSSRDLYTDLASHLAPPSAGTLRNVLAAVAAGTGAILGLVVTISLIVFQSSAGRYRSDRIIGFLIPERVDRFVVRLLALSFLYSI